MRTALALWLLLPAAALAGDWEDSLRFWENEGQADALYCRARAIDRVAQAGEGKGIPLLRDRYKSPRSPHPDEERFLIAGALRWVRSDDASRAALQAWVSAQKGKDPWLEHNALASLETKKLLGLAQDPKEDAWRRASAAQVLGAAHDLETVVAGLAAAAKPEALPKSARDLALVAGGFGAALLQLQTRIQNDPDGGSDSDLQPLLDALLGVRAHEKLPVHARKLLERRLARFGERRGEAQEEEPDADGGTRLAGKRGGSRFMGIEVSGRERIVYVVDCSDSMLAPLTGEEVRRLKETPRPRKGPRTGDGAGDAPSPAADERQLPWDRIKTRFDAAKAFLVLSLQALDPETRFAVVVFGDEAKLLKSTPRLVEASAASIKAVTAEIEAFAPGPPAAGRPNGTVMGQTNLHAAIRLAWQVSTKGTISPEACASPKNPSETLADTVFLLSDGEPTRDDFKGKSPERDVQAGTVSRTDPETGATSTTTTEAGKASEELEGPYRDLEWFQRDLERLNLFRWTQLHVVGLGECDERWSRLLVRLGEGELKIVGGKAPKDE